MRKNLTGKAILIIAILLVFVFGIFGIPNGVSGQAWKDALTKRISLGLDLKGGTHLVLQVMVDEAVGAETDNALGRLQSDLQAAGVSVGSILKPNPSDPTTIQISGVPANKSGDARNVLDTKYGQQYNISSTADGFTLTLKPAEVQALEKKAMQNSIETITTRINSLGVTEPTVQEYGLGKNQILVELPGVDDPGRVRDIIQSTARLEIHAVTGGPYATQDAAKQANGGTIPPDQELLPYGGTNDAEQGQYYLLQRIAVVSGSDFRDAQPGRDENGRPDATFILTRAAGDRFYDFTSKNVNKPMAVVLDNKVQEVANIQEAIRDQGRISGLGEQKAKDLSLMLRTGALPASIHYLEERTVGPSLGADSIRKGVTASIVGMLAVMIFMLVYYKGAGINADLALFLNLVILLGFMGFTGATMTLPGIAGVILTVGMGVDSNVLIFERIREEVRAGKSAAAAVDQGFAHAWTTILDTHVTTMVSAAILFLFGTGPVKGFAVTLVFGLGANLFTAVFVSRTIFDAILNRKQRGEALSI
ncbi:MAG TPA: protein translocase subunit SecD [Acidobacteriaceae bacterium]|nr:protein translocase subunit SecD [Acidobacteriaceae bacterium]